MKYFLIILRSLLYVPAFILFFGWLALSSRAFDPRIALTIPGWTSIPGILLMIIGALLVLVCVTVFIARGRGTPAVFDPPVEFVATGPYAFVRNPMYIGGFILLAGFGLYHRSPSMLLFMILLIPLFHLFVVFVEEPLLKAKFGKPYLDYQRQVRRWVPKFPRSGIRGAS